MEGGEWTLKREKGAIVCSKGEGMDGKDQALGTILVVDDDEVIQTVAKLVLQATGFDVVTANDGLEAVEIFRERAESIDLVLLDVVMPRKDGHQTLLELRGIREDVRVLLSSGTAQQNLEKRYAGRELAGFLAKPYYPTELIEAVRRALGSLGSSPVA